MEALDVEPSRRSAFLLEACPDQGAIRREVEDLLHAVDDAGSFMGKPDAAPPAMGEKAGDRIGDYMLREPLGEGGFGVVFLADQERPVRRQVALKIIKLGMDTRQVVARFEAERQALAVMDHPCIARVFDAGATAGGRPYFVMEVVRGLPITRYADQHRLSIRERLELFIRVCEAVHHAHQKGVIHRDLKPSNVLVAVHEGTSQPAPKIIDFGIAKATTEARTPGMTLTEARQLIGTPEYMAPEQADYDADIDTRADVYSLGVMLYELLVGIPPLDRRRLRTGDAAEIQRYLREQEPLRPSTRLRAMPDESPSGREVDPSSPSTREITRTRAIDVPTLVRQLKGDLDWIAMKCLEKDRTRRYDSAAALADDLRRFLANEPVLAGPPTARYRLRKAIVRHKVAFMAGSAVVVALVVGLGAAWSQYLQMRSERDQKDDALRAVELQRARAESGETAANKARLRAERLAEFMKGMLSAVAPHKAAGRDTTLLRETLEAATTRAEEELADAPDIQAELLKTIGETYRNIAQFDKAEVVLRRACDLYASFAKPTDREYVQCRLALGMTLRFGTKQREAEQLAAEVLERAKDAGNVPEDLVSEFMLLRADALNDLGKFDDAMPIARECIDRFAGDPDREADARLVLAAGLRRRGKLDEARRQYEQAIAHYVFRSPDKDVALGAALNNLGVVLDYQGKASESEAMYRESLGLRRRLYDRAHPDVAVTLMNLGDNLTGQGRLEEAIPLLQESVDLHHAIYNGKHVGEAIAIDRLGMALMRLGRLDEAEELLARSREIIHSLRPPGHPDIITSLSNLAMLRRAQGRPAESESLVREALDLMEQAGNTSPAFLAPLAQALADSLQRQDKHEEALVAFDRSIEACEKTSGTRSPNCAHVRCMKAASLVALGRYDEAEVGLDALVETIVQRRGAASSEAANARSVLARVLAHRQRFEEAIALLSSTFDSVQTPDAINNARLRKRTAELAVECLHAWNASSPGSVTDATLALWQGRAASFANESAPSSK
jgi:serine/threonine protein kinase/tetratricopeptide (TPR) repeat protein